MAILSDTDSVIDALGGTGAVAAIFGCRSQRVSNWRVSGLFPPDTFETFCRELSKQNMAAPLSLWRQVPTDQLARMTVARSAISTGACPEALVASKDSLATTQRFSGLEAA